MIEGQHQWTQKGPDGKPVRKRVGDCKFACYKCGLVQEVLISKFPGKTRSRYSNDEGFFKHMPKCEIQPRPTWHEKLMSDDT